MEISAEQKKTLFEIVKQKIRDEEAHVADLIRKILDLKYEAGLSQNRSAQLKADLEELSKDPKENEEENTSDENEKDPVEEPVKDTSEDNVSE